MPRNVVVLLGTEEGRALVRKKCAEANLQMSVLEDLLEAELDQTGKQRHRGIVADFDEILDEPENDTSTSDEIKPPEAVREEA